MSDDTCGLLDYLYPVCSQTCACTYMNSCYFCCLGQVVPKKMCQFCLPFAVVGEGVLAAVPAAASAPSSASGFAVVHLLRTQN